MVSCLKGDALIAENIAADAINILEERDKVREEVLKTLREIGRLARKVVMNIHSGDEDKAAKMLNKAKEKVLKVKEFKESHPELYYTGSVLGTLAEYSEAFMLYNYIFKDKLANFKEVGVEPAAYLLGLSDLIGELRRYMLKLIDESNFEAAERTLKIMEEIYSSLMEIVLPEALVPGLRRKLDINRITLENSRKDLLFHKQSYILLRELKRLLK